jgi:O-antigen/teichoic acid export membrane protein
VIIIKRKTIVSSVQTILVPTKGIMVFGFSFFILDVWLSLSQHINSIIISHDLGVVWQGYYDVSLSMVAVITFFSSAIYLISGPETTIKNNRSDILSKRGGFGDIGKFLLSMCLLCVIILYFYSQQLTTLLFTNDYLIAGDYLIILAIGYTVLFIQQYIAFLNISVEGETGLSRLSLVTIASIVIFPFFTHFMILYFGFMGVYLATTIFIICYTLVTIVLIKDRTPLLLLLSKIDRLILAVAGTFLIIKVLQLSLIPGIITAFLLFVILVLSLGYVDKNFLLGMIRFNSKKI